MDEKNNNKSQEKKGEKMQESLNPTRIDSAIEADKILREMDAASESSDRLLKSRKKIYKHISTL